MKKNKQTKKNPAAVALGRLGGLKGGPARAKKLTPEHRRDIATWAASLRWTRAKGMACIGCDDEKRVLDYSTDKPYKLIPCPYCKTNENNERNAE